MAGFERARRREARRRVLLWCSVATLVAFPVAFVVTGLTGTPFGGLPVLVLWGIAVANIIDRENDGYPTGYPPSKPLRRKGASITRRKPSPVPAQHLPPPTRKVI